MPLVAGGWMLRASAGRRVPNQQRMLTLLALGIFGFGSGMAFLAHYLDARWSLGLPRWTVSRFPLLVIVPAILAGAPYFAKYMGLAWSWSLILFGAWMAASVLWVDPTERGRGLVISVSFMISWSLAGLIHRIGAQRWFAIWLGLGYTAGVVGAILSGAQSRAGRFGCFVFDGTRLANSIELGCISVAIAVIMYGLTATRASERRGRRGTAIEPLWLPIMIGLLAVAVTLATVTRTAGLALAVAGVLICARHVKRTLVIMPAILAVALVILPAIPWRSVGGQWESRVTGDDLSTANNRTAIWTAAMAINERQGWRSVLGLGCGGLDKALGEELGGGRRHPADGIRRVSSHNQYLEWLCELGVVGVVLAAWLGWVSLRSARKLDHRDGTVQRTALLVVLAIVGLAAAATKFAMFPGLAALLWAMLAAPRRRQEDTVSHMPNTMGSGGCVQNAILKRTAPAEPTHAGP